uniref:Uncharacterized protein n=1 Tax=Rhizophora mucronata TaxID=61149 RepID=A0A2P2NDU6_RHIMU
MHIAFGYARSCITGSFSATVGPF